MLSRNYLTGCHHRGYSEVVVWFWLLHVSSLFGQGETKFSVMTSCESLIRLCLFNFVSQKDYPQLSCDFIGEWDMWMQIPIQCLQLVAIRSSETWLCSSLGLLVPIRVHQLGRDWQCLVSAITIVLPNIGCWYLGWLSFHIHQKFWPWWCSSEPCLQWEIISTTVFKADRIIMLSDLLLSDLLVDFFFEWTWALKIGCAYFVLENRKMKSLLKGAKHDRAAPLFDKLLFNKVSQSCVIPNMCRPSLCCCCLLDL